MTITQIYAVLVLLQAFGVGQQTVSTVQDILLASIATSTPIVLTLPEPPTQAPEQPQPQIISQPTPMAEPVIVETLEYQVQTSDGVTSLFASLKRNGKEVLQAPITMSVPGGATVTKNANNQTKLKSANWYASFDLPQGVTSVTLTSGDTSVDVSL